MIAPAQLQSIADFVSTQVLSDALVQHLKRAFPEFHFTYCMDDDVCSSRPVVENQGFNLYLIDSSEHCLTFTQDAAIATGVVIAEIEYA